jgi:predicted dehydrogenase
LAAALRVALIGAGRMGANHARVLAAIEGARLVGIHDRSPERAQALAETHGCAVLRSLADVRGAADAAIVAVSSSAHAEIGTALLADGIPCLIEKPLAIDEAQCRALIAAAEKAAVPLAVGHVERFNPAVGVAADVVAGARILALEGRRLNPGSARIQDTDVVIDLMVHDIDTVNLLLGAAPSDVAAHGIAVAQPGLADHATALLSFRGGAVASLVASRLAQMRVRTLTIFCAERTVTLDYLGQSVTVAHDGAEAPAAVPVQKAAPLERELRGFVASVRGGRGADIVGAEEALRGLAVAWAVQRRLAAHLPAAAAERAPSR